MSVSLEIRGAAHDIRHLLSTIRLTAEMLEATGPSDVQRRAQRILRAVDRSTEICSSLVGGGTQAKASVQPPSNGGRGLRALLDDVVGQLSPPAGLRISVDCPKDHALSGPDALLFRALFNLANNAVDALSAGQGSQITLRGRALDGRLVVSVEDDGPGLGQSSARQSGAPVSAGLGLQVVRRCASDLGGHLKLVRTGPDGTIFALVLPGKPPEAPTMPAEFAMARAATMHSAPTPISAA